MTRFGWVLVELGDESSLSLRIVSTMVENQNVSAGMGVGKCSCNFKNGEYNLLGKLEAG